MDLDLALGWLLKLAASWALLAIPYSLATLGGQTEVPTVDGPVKIRVRAGTQSQTMLRLRGKGAPILRGRGRGDEYVRIVVAVPDRLDRYQKELVKKLQEEGL